VKHVVGFSGGIDSQACARWVLNRYPAEDVILLYADPGGNDHPLTTAHIQWYSMAVHPVTIIHPMVLDMWEGEDQPTKHGYHPNEPLTFDLMAQIKGRFPSRRAQFCTEKLKLRPSRRWMRHWLDGETEYERYSGVRRDESTARRDTPDREWDHFFDCYINYPVATWTKQDCFDYVQAYGERVNPLYALGFTRVGCAPCINSGKDDLVNWARRFPDMIEKVRGWEARVGRTFFAPIVPGLPINWIDDVVRWAGTGRGGTQGDLLKMYVPLAACESKYGLCE
jgi:hypothetical protein